MLELLLIATAFFVLQRQLAALEAGTAASLTPRRQSPRLAQMSDYADRLFAEKKWLAAEKAYLGVLKFDHKNITAYSHLGIIYSTQKNMPDAIECFQIACRLRPSGVTYQNLGLAYFDNRNFIKSIAAYEKAIMFEATSQRYLGLSKAQRKLSNLAAAITALERAAELEPSKRVLQILAETYGEAGRQDAATATRKRLSQLNDHLPAAKTT
jgi:tetratricopeptide (TPR) repeat protein